MTDTGIALVRFTNEYLDRVWGAAVPWLVKACEANGDLTVEEIAEDLVRAKQQLWLLWDYDRKDDPCIGALTTRVELSSKGEKIGVMVAVGADDINIALTFVPQVEEFFRSEGCARMRAIGRRGWARRLKDFHLIWVALEKSLTEGQADA